MEQKFIRRKIKWVIIVLLGFVFAGMIFVLLPFPKNDTLSGDLPDKFSVPLHTGFELQGKNQCAAFSSAFVLRNFGQPAKGSEVYEKLPFKIPISGYVLPKGVILSLQSSGLNPILYKGNLNSLKQRLVKLDNPIIVLVGNGLFWQHYMTFVGFDDEKKELYFFDSNKETDENGSLPGNRTMTSDYFLKWWNNGLPIFNHVYITVRRTL